VLTLKWVPEKTATSKSWNQCESCVFGANIRQWHAN